MFPLTLYSVFPSHEINSHDYINDIESKYLLLCLSNAYQSELFIINARCMHTRVSTLFVYVCVCVHVCYQINSGLYSRMNFNVKISLHNIVNIFMFVNILWYNIFTSFGAFNIPIHGVVNIFMFKFVNI